MSCLGMQPPSFCRVARKRNWSRGFASRLVWLARLGRAGAIVVETEIISRLAALPLSTFLSVVFLTYKHVVESLVPVLDHEQIE